MFPWVYGFTWTAGNVIFLGLFFLVVVVLGTTVLFSTLKALRDLRNNDVELIRWESDFHDLPRAARICRHEFTGEFKNRVCDNKFECRDCETHAKLLLRSSLVRQPLRPEDHPCGFNMPADRFYHRGHTWVRPESDGIHTIGLDDFATRLVGTPDGIELPLTGTQLRVNGTAWSISKGKSSFRVLAPIDGEVVETGDQGKGWFLRVKSVGTANSTAHLLRGYEVSAWISREFERLQHLLADEKVGLTMADGGTPMQDLASAYPEKNWDRIFGDVFLES